MLKFNHTRILGFALSICLLISSSASIYAQETILESEEVANTHSDTVSLKLGEDTFALAQEKLDDGNVVRLYTDKGILYQQTVYDATTDTLMETTYDSETGLEISQELYNLNTIVSNEETNTDSLPESINNTESSKLRASYNYLFDEPLLDSDVSLDTCSDGYKYIGKTTYDGHNGYLRRSQSTSLASAKRFTFSSGTKVTTAVSAIAAVWTGFTTSNLVGALTSVGLSLASAVIDYACSSSVTYITIHNLYRVNVASSTRYSFCEKKTYWKTYVYCDTLNKEVTEYDSRSWIHGYTGTLYDNVVFAIQCYENGEIIDGTC